MSYETLTVTDPAPHVVQVTLNRPEVANAFNTTMAGEIMEVFERFQLGLGEARVVILTGAGERAFCAGGDLKQRLGMTNEEWHAQHLVFERMVRAVLACPLPVIGAINGAAYGGGCELAGAVDFAHAARHAKFAQTEVKLGIIPGAGGTQTLSRKMGTARAQELILSGRPFTAEEAAQWGLLNGVHEGAELMGFVMELARDIAGNAPIAVRQAKMAITRGAQMSLSDALAFEIECYNHTFPSEDRHEGVAAFNEKRKPVFKGR